MTQKPTYETLIVRDTDPAGAEKQEAYAKDRLIVTSACIINTNGERRIEPREPHRGEIERDMVNRFNGS